MTHYTVGILIPTEKLPQAKQFIAEQLAPYDEKLQVAPYICYDLDQADVDRKCRIRDLELLLASDHKNYNVEYCRTSLRQLQDMTSQEFYEEYLQGHDLFDEECRPLSTYNPASRWDWYVIGGRWDGWLTGRETSTNSVDDNAAPVAEVLENGRFPFALLTPDGQWHEKGKMGWFAIALNEKDDDVWQAELRQILERYQDHHMVLVDAHI